MKLLQDGAQPLLFISLWTIFKHQRGCKRVLRVSTSEHGSRRLKPVGLRASCQHAGGAELAWLCVCGETVILSFLT